MTSFCQTSKMIILIFALVLSHDAFSSGAALVFHVGMKDDHAQTIGITIDNNLDPEKYHYYVTYILMDEKCRPGSPVTTELKGLTTAQQSTVYIPVSTPFTYYRILNFFVYNDMGIPSPVSDDTRNVITGRDPAFIESCNKIRNQ